ncbi:DUF3775 domain-containing protein [Algihabitans albus]|uniref:DUF3775 domain-containing protein n=1 Tax=Algihabitans albus TaxID=2164067 RepID=UPI000E5C861F|nr:DUF3775 domain-containing protein [Algihabitans albus]
MLEMDVDKVCFVVVKMREYEEEGLIRAETEDDEVELDEDAEEELESSGGLDGEDVDEDDEEPLETASEDGILEELTTFIRNLDEEEQVELVALTWLGRGDYEVDQWSEATETASERHNSRTAEYLIGIPLLPDYLEEGLAAFDLSCVDFDESRL